MSRYGLPHTHKGKKRTVSRFFLFVVTNDRTSRPLNIRNGQSGAQTDVIVDANDRIIASINQLQTGALKSVSNDIEAADTAPGKVKALSSQLAALADEAKKAGGFQQAFGPLGDILDVGSVKGITQEQESRVSPGTPVGKPAATHTAALLMAL